MECQNKKCKKRFGEAGNIREYKIVCPHCRHIQKCNSSKSGGAKWDVKNAGKKNVGGIKTKRGILGGKNGF